MQKTSFPLRFRSFTLHGTQLRNVFLPLYYCRWLKCLGAIHFLRYFLSDVMNEH